MTRQHICERKKRVIANVLVKLTLKQAKAFTCDVFGIWGPRHRSTRGPHRYTVIVLSSGSSLMISTCTRTQLRREIFLKSRCSWTTKRCSDMVWVYLTLIKRIVPWTRCLKRTPKLVGGSLQSSQKAASPATKRHSNKSYDLHRSKRENTTQHQLYIIKRW